MLAAALGYRLRPRFDRRLHWFRVGAWDTSTLVEMMALRFGTSRVRERMTRELRDFLSDVPRLVVLDNHENDRAMAWLLEALSDTRATFVLTARRCLLSGVVLFPVTAPLVTTGKIAFPRVKELHDLLRANPLALDGPGVGRGSRDLGRGARTISRGLGRLSRDRHRARGRPARSRAARPLGLEEARSAEPHDARRARAKRGRPHGRSLDRRARTRAATRDPTCSRAAAALAPRAGAHARAFRASCGRSPRRRQADPARSGRARASRDAALRRLARSLARASPDRADALFRGHGLRATRT